LREALRFLATATRVHDLRITMLEYLSIFEDDPEPMDQPLDFSAKIPMDWREGVEDLKGFTTDELWQKLGLPDKAIPFFNTTSDPFGTHDPWVDLDWFSNPSHVSPFGPRWHQLQGILRMVERAFEGKPVLLMDEVGLGKTLQVVAVIAILAFYREHFGKYSRFPGIFGEFMFDQPVQIYSTDGKLHVSKYSLSRQTW
jgi:hypothetical protein